MNGFMSSVGGLFSSLNISSGMLNFNIFNTGGSFINSVSWNSVQLKGLFSYDHGGGMYSVRNYNLLYSWNPPPSEGIVKVYGDDSSQVYGLDERPPLSSNPTQAEINAHFQYANAHLNPQHKTAAGEYYMAGGDDRVYATDGIDKIYGGDGNDSLYGKGGNDVLVGGRGVDTLAGGAGADTFVFDSQLLAGMVGDRIVDFAAGDIIQIHKSVFSGVAGSGALTASQFAANTTGLAADADDRIIYQSTTGKVFYDPDGNGNHGAFEFALLAPNLGVNNTAFYVV
ncbi:calcium-binding protein [Ensifer sp. ENS04]|uniref:calcium-binding protein n=1 Tax=Ensifer sp. ENS04 TaxID=2769281 RepID=UPI001784BFA9|nr:calcium-binding protein [Ensifer sp. ENS04]MBD9538961.1 calcium-binding protein [Ensifer sp. ENS04]